MDYAWDFSALAPYTGLLWKGLWITIVFTVTTSLAGLVIGLVAGILRTNTPRWVSVPVVAYIEIFRCTPLLVQIVWMYYALPVLIQVEMSPGLACFLTLSLYGGAFYAEIFRGGIESVDRGQWEAGRALGMRRSSIFFRLILPQAVRVMIPSFINQTVLQLKNTSLISTVAVGDLLYEGSVISAAIYRPLETYTVVAVVYFAVLFPLTLAAQRLEARMGAHR
jgi:polar amino acid transport system permease protein